MLSAKTVGDDFLPTIETHINTFLTDRLRS